MNPRSVIVAKAALLVAFPVALVTSLSACTAHASFGTSTVTGDKLATSVESQLIRSNASLTITGTHCDDASDVAPGHTTACTATVNGQATKLVVTWKNTKGDYEVNSVAS